MVCCPRCILEDMVVALRKESVDRNKWIKNKYPGCRVALRKESVDRNTNFSPAGLFDLPVALRKESVDRNHVVLVVPRGCWRRSPQGERG